MDVGLLYIVYFVVLIISFIILYFLVDTILALLISSIIGAIIVFISAVWIDTNNLNNEQSTCLAILVIIAFLLPIIFLVIIAMDSFNCSSVLENNQCPDREKCCKI